MPIACGSRSARSWRRSGSRTWRTCAGPGASCRSSSDAGHPTIAERQTRMALGSLFDQEAPPGPDSGDEGPRAFLTRPQVIGVRALIAIYIATILLLTVANYRPVGDALFRLSSMYLTARLVIGLMGSATVLTFFLLLGMSLHHFFRGHVGPRPAAGWLWVVLLLNVAGVVAYYLMIIEPEQKSLMERSPGGAVA